MAAKQKSWRVVLPVHPAAELFPMMSDDELEELGADIEKHGLRSPIVFWVEHGHDPDDIDPETGADAKDDCEADETIYLLDGRNRLAAMEKVGIELRYESPPDDDDEDWLPSDWDPTNVQYAKGGRSVPTLLLHGAWHDTDEGTTPDTDPYDYVLSANAYRRHLTATQKRELTAQVLKAQPEKSDRQIAKQTGVSHPTVAKERKKLTETGDVENVSTRTDTKGRKQPATKAIDGGKATKTPTAVAGMSDEETEKLTARISDDQSPITANSVAHDAEEAEYEAEYDAEAEYEAERAAALKKAPYTTRQELAHLSEKARQVQKVASWVEYIDLDPEFYDADLLTYLHDDLGDLRDAAWSLGERVLRKQEAITKAKQAK